MVWRGLTSIFDFRFLIERRRRRRFTAEDAEGGEEKFVVREGLNSGEQRRSVSNSSSEHNPQQHTGTDEACCYEVQPYDAFEGHP